MQRKSFFERILNMTFKKSERPERIIQFGEGGFLRGFVDWMVQSTFLTHSVVLSFAMTRRLHNLS